MGGLDFADVAFELLQGHKGRGEQRGGEAVRSAPAGLAERRGGGVRCERVKVSGGQLVLLSPNQALVRGHLALEEVLVTALKIRFQPAP